MEAKNVAQYIFAKYDNVGDLITNKKLQKILYYIKAWGLVYFDNEDIKELKPIFSERHTIPTKDFSPEF